MDIENRRYIGSKAKLLDWIFEHVKRECKGNSFADIFAGTGVVSARAARTYNKIILNDLLHSNFAVYQGFFAQEKYDREKVFNFVSHYNSINPVDVEHNFFSKNFGGKFFDTSAAKLIGFIREDLKKRRGELNNKEYHILLTSLLYSADKIANTVGHYEAYFKNSISDRNFSFRLIEPLIKAGSVSIYREDANKLAHKLKADIVYIDPPYNSRQYSRFYHVLETLALWDNPKLSGVALKRPEENMSDYCRVKASTVFADLIKNLETKYIVVSYNNTYKSKSSSSRNKIELETIEQILNSKGKTKVFKKNHQFFNAGKTNFDDHQEFLFITKVK
ncbi:DNA adenine methylase [Candidatus Parcubacteria bacterium]|nr:DNA adenine methylase [Candidatus Parcubacteria bacterium]